MNKGKLIRFLAIGGGAAIASSLVTVNLFGMNKVPQPKSFSYDVYEYHYDVSGDVASEFKYTFAYREDGSYVQTVIYEAPDGTPLEQRTVVDFQQRRRLAIMPPGKSVRTYPMTSDTAEILMARQAGCQNLFSDQSERLGYRVALNRKQLSDETLNIRSESWRAPDLGCIPLESWVIASQSDGIDRVLTYRRAENVRVGEPDPALFEVPDGYTERSPSEAALARAELYPSFSVQTDAEFWKRLDAVYRESQGAGGRPR